MPVVPETDLTHVRFSIIGRFGLLGLLALLIFVPTWVGAQALDSELVEAEETVELADAVAIQAVVKPDVSANAAEKIFRSRYEPQEQEAGPFTDLWSTLTQLQPYLRVGFGGGRIFDNNDDPALSLEDPIGEAHISVSVGVNIDRHWSAELAIDFIETNLNSPIHNKIAELAVWNILAQVRYRLPIGNRFEPYVLAGAGLSLSEVNDFAIDARAHPILGRKDAGFVGSVGAGLDFYIADNLAIGVESKYLYGVSSDMFFEGTGRTLDLDGVVTTLGLRMNLNGRDRETGDKLPPARDSNRWRAYLAMRAGKPFYTDQQITPILENDAAANEILFGFSAGVNIGRHLGLEIAGEGAETALFSDGFGNVAEMAHWTAVGQVRLRYPVMDDRLTPYLVAGGGLGWSQVNDRNVVLSAFDLAGETQASPVATLGVGLDYFLSHNIALNIEAKHTFFFERDIRVQGAKANLDLSYFGLSGGLRVFFN